MYVFDATPLIYLAKIDHLELLTALPPTCVIPESVYQEVVTCGLAEDHPDARRIERAVEDGVFETIDGTDTEGFDRLQRNERLSRADVAVLAIAAANDGVAIMDEAYGRDVADTENIETRGTAYLVLWLLRDGHISESTAIESVDSMLEAGWYCSPPLYKSIRQKIDDLG